MTRLLGNHARKRNDTCQNRKPMRDGESQALVAYGCGRWKGLRKRLKGLRAGKRQARTPLKTDGWGMERPAEGFAGFEGGQTAGSNVLKNRWLGHVAARVVVAGFEAFEGFEGGQTAGSNALKNRWLGHVAEALEGLANGRLERPLKQMAGAACGCESCCQLPWKGLGKGLKRLKGLRAACGCESCCQLR